MRYTTKFRSKHVRLVISERAGDVRGIVPAHHHGHQNGQQRGGYFASSFCLLSPWRPQGRYGESSCPMAAFSGFYKSPGLPPSADARGIAPSHSHGYWNGQQQRYIRSLLSPLLFDQNVARRPCYGPFNLTPSYYINLIGVISAAADNESRFGNLCCRRTSPISIKHRGQQNKLISTLIYWIY